MFSKCAQCVGCLMGTLPLGPALFRPTSTASPVERARMEMVRAYHAVETAPRGHLCPRPSEPLGRLTLFQQPWTGKPSSPCGEEGSTRLRLSGRPIEQAGWGHRTTHCGSCPGSWPLPALVYFFSIPISSRPGPWRRQEASPSVFPWAQVT